MGWGQLLMTEYNEPNDRLTGSGRHPVIFERCKAQQGGSYPQYMPKKNTSFLRRQESGYEEPIEKIDAMMGRAHPTQ